MLTFKNITPEDKDVIQSFTLVSKRMNCDLSFANLCSWSFLYHTQFALMNNYLIFRFHADGELSYMMPVGSGDVKPVLEALISDAEAQGSKFRMLGVCSNMKAKIEAAMPGCFTFSENRDYFDYIYLREDLATLKGKKYQPKRNHINKFKKQYPDYEYQPLTSELVPECLSLAADWCRVNHCDEDEALMGERESATYALNHLEALGLKGGILRVNGRIVAFTYGAPINADTWDTCVEKADTTVEGAYAMINYEYANHIGAQYTYINREEDLGLEGLRKAKLSYQPVILLEKSIAELR